jgi:osmoprotectant transport system ATP-binding protein
VSYTGETTREACAGAVRNTMLECNAMNPAIEFRDVAVVTRQGQCLLDHISLALEGGSTTVLLGRSGAGKTTLLRTVNRMVALTSGEVLIEDRSVADADLIALRRGIGYVIQETGLFPHFTVGRNVGIVLEAQGVAPQDRKRRSDELLSAVGLTPGIFAKRFPHQLSGGQRQRVGLARALAADPKILLMDEPFGALDPLTRTEMQEMLRALLGRLRKTVLLVTHDLDEALYLGDRIVLVEDGKVVADLNSDEFLDSEQPEVATYVRAFHRSEPNQSRVRAH